MILNIWQCLGTALIVTAGRRVTVAFRGRDQGRYKHRAMRRTPCLPPAHPQPMTKNYLAQTVSSVVVKTHTHTHFLIFHFVAT